MRTSPPPVTEYEALRACRLTRGRHLVTLPAGARLRVAEGDDAIRPAALARLVAEGDLRAVARWHRGRRTDLAPDKLGADWPNW